MSVDFNEAHLRLVPKSRLALAVPQDDGVYGLHAHASMDDSDKTRIYYYFEIIADTQSGKRNIAIQ